METLYFLCVDFMIVFANLLGITYRDANIIVLFIFLPSVIFVDLLIYIHYITWRKNENNENTTKTIDIGTIK